MIKTKNQFTFSKLYNIYIISFTLLLLFLYFFPFNQELRILLTGSRIDQSARMVFLSSTYEKVFSELIFVSVVLTLLSIVLGLFILLVKRNIVEFFGIVLFSMIPRERKEWGTIFDKNSKQGVPLSNIRFYSDDGKIIAQTISDINGRYRMSLYNIEEGKPYKLDVQSNGYAKLEKEIKFFKPSVSFIDDIPLEPQNKNQHRKRIYLNVLLGQKTYLFLSLILYINSILILVVSAYKLSSNAIAINFLTFYASIIAVIWNGYMFIDMGEVKNGRILSMGSETPLENVIVKIKTENEDIISTSDKDGFVKFDIPPGTYKAKIFTYEKDFSENGDSKYIDLVIQKNGHLKNDILVS